MTLTYSQAKVIYQGDGETTQWAIPFPYLQTADLQVVRIGADGTESVLSGDFTVDTDLNVLLYPMEGSQTLPLAEGEKLLLRRRTPLTQQAAFGAQQSFDPAVLEAGYDKAMMIAQEQAEELARTVRFPASSAGIQTDAAHYLQELQQAQLDADKANAAAQSAVTAAQNALQTAQQAVDSASAAAETVTGSVSAAQSAATAAQTSAGSADTFAQAASSSQQAAAGSAASASASADLAQRWAVKMDGAVAEGEYSAKYHAQQAAASATAADGFASTATTQATNAAGSAELAQKWATQTDSEVAQGQGYGAQKYAQDAASSASSAAASATAAAAAADQAADKAQTDLSNVSQLSQSRVDTIMPANMDYVVESGSSGSTWYRKYKSGWIEQGGYTDRDSSGGDYSKQTNVTFLKAFTQTPLQILVSPYTPSYADGINFVLKAYNASTTGFIYFWQGGDNRHYIVGSFWYACGK